MFRHTRSISLAFLIACGNLLCHSHSARFIELFVSAGPFVIFNVAILAPNCPEESKVFVEKSPSVLFFCTFTNEASFFPSGTLQLPSSIVSVTAGTSNI